MSGKILRALLFGALGLLLSGAASGFLLMRSAGIADQQFTLLTRTRGRELVVALATMAGESSSGPARVRLSATMNRVTSTSRGRADAFEIQEIALVDRDGKVLAHNDIAKVAGKAEPSFAGAKFDAVMNLPERDPVSFEVMESKAARVPLPEFAEEFRDTLAPLLPDLPAVPTKVMINAAVFRVDEEAASARLHMIVVVRSGAAYQKSLLPLLFEGLAASGIVALAFFLIALAVFLTARKAPATSKTKKDSDGETAEDEAAGDEAAEASGDADRKAAESAEPLSHPDSTEELVAQDEAVPPPEPIARATPVEPATVPGSAGAATVAAAAAATAIAAGGAASHSGTSRGAPPPIQQRPYSPPPPPAPAQSAPHAAAGSDWHERPRTVRIAEEDEIPDAIPLD